MAENDKEEKITAKEVLSLVIYFAIVIIAMFLIIHFVEIGRASCRERV